jgi:hypothetical protein
VGIKPVLLDRRGAYEDIDTCHHIRDMAALVKLFEEGVLD